MAAAARSRAPERPQRAEQPLVLASGNAAVTPSLSNGGKATNISPWPGVNRDPTLSRQLATPADHFRLLAPSQNYEHLLWLRGRKATEGREWYRLNRETALQTLSKYTDEPEVFVTPNEFYGWRLIRLLTGLNAFYVDIDVHNGEACPVRTAWNAIGRIETARIPIPNMIVYTGRGAHLYWLFERTPKQALPRWQAVQRTLVTLTRGDSAVVDATRVLRVVGSRNTAAEDSVKRAVTAEVLNDQRYQFDWLCDQIIIPRAEIRDLRAARACKDAKEGRASGAPRNLGSIYKVWYLRYQDLIKISDAHWFGGVPQGHRNQMLMHMAVSLSWFTRSEALVNEIEHVAAHHMPSLTESEIRTCVSSVVKRATDAADGKHYDWGGRQVDPRYKFKTSTLWETFGALVTPDLMPQLRAILPEEERARRTEARQKARNRAVEGRYTTSRISMREARDKRREEALQLRQRGWGTAAIAKHLQVDESTVRRDCRAVVQAGTSAPLVYDTYGLRQTQMSEEALVSTVWAMHAERLSERAIATKTKTYRKRVHQILETPRLPSQCGTSAANAPLLYVEGFRPPERSDPPGRGVESVVSNTSSRKGVVGEGVLPPPSSPESSAGQGGGSDPATEQER